MSWTHYHRTLKNANWQDMGDFRMAVVDSWDFDTESSGQSGIDVEIQVNESADVREYWVLSNCYDVRERYSTRQEAENAASEFRSAIEDDQC